jgi:catechol 2,3-dioxygenase-like lactoylglutathione lyase family enzyme
MNDSERQRLGLPPMDQVGFVVRDMEAALALYDPLFGPFEVQDYGEINYRYRGSDEDARLLIAFGHSGDIEIELIQWLSGGTPHKEFLDAGREGIHHLRFRVDNVESLVDAAEPLGYRAIWHKRFDEMLAFAYLERQGDPLLVELFEDRHAQR